MTITPEEAEAMVALALEQAAAFVKAEAGSFPDEVAWAVEDLATAILTLRPDAFAALSSLREADRAEIARLQKKRVEDAAFLNSQMQRAETAEARLTALEADREKVAETALRMAAGVVEDHAPGGVHYEYGHDDGSMRVAIRSAILAITPAAVLAAVDSACTPT